MTSTIDDQLRGRFEAWYDAQYPQRRREGWRADRYKQQDLTTYLAGAQAGAELREAAIVAIVNQAGALIGSEYPPVVRPFLALIIQRINQRDEARGEGQ